MMRIVSLGAALLAGVMAAAQSFTAVSSTEGGEWRLGKAGLERRAVAEPLLEVGGGEEGTPFAHWGHCFN